MADFAGLKKLEHDLLVEAATVFRNVTGKDLLHVVKKVPVADEVDENEDPTKVAARASKELHEQAKVAKAREDAQQAERRTHIASEKARLTGTTDDTHSAVVAPVAPVVPDEKASKGTKKSA